VQDLKVRGNSVYVGASWFSFEKSRHYYLTVRDNMDLSLQWCRIFNNSYIDNSPVALAIDSSENVYLTGSAIVGADQFNFLTVRYTSSGVLNGSWRYAGIVFPSSGYSAAFPVAITIDKSDNVYVTGETAYWLDPFKRDFVTMKLNLGGTATLWTKSYHDAAADSLPVAMAVDSDGNIWVTGFSDTAPGFLCCYNIVTVKYSPYDGSALW